MNQYKPCVKCKTKTPFRVRGKPLCTRCAIAGLGKVYSKNKHKAVLAH